MLWRCSTTGGGYTENTTYRWSGTAWASDAAAMTQTPDRNVIIQGDVDVAGIPTLFEAGSGLACKLNATGINTIVTFMDGNSGSLGSVNKIGIINADNATFWSALPSNATVYLYIELDETTIQGGYSVYAPKYQHYPPTHVSGLDWIDYNEAKCWNSNGSTWTQKYRVYVGWARTDGTSITSVFVYPYNRTPVVMYPWTEKYLLSNPIDTFISQPLPLSRNGTMATIDFYCVGTPSASTNIVVKQGSTTVGTAAISAAGKTTLTFSATVIGTAEDLFTYNVAGNGLVECTILCNQKWVNR